MDCIKVELPRQNRKAGATLFAMNKITQTARYRQSLIHYAQKNGVTAAAKLEKKTKALIELIRENPYQAPPQYEKLQGDLCILRCSTATVAALSSRSAA